MKAPCHRSFSSISRASRGAKPERLLLRTLSASSAHKPRTSWTRAYSNATTGGLSHEASYRPQAPPDPRLPGQLSSRLGTCIKFGLSNAQVDKAGAVLADLAKDWRGLVVGAEGFLTDRRRAGLYRQAVVWGEMLAGACNQGLNGHVNNVVYNRYAETGRVNWVANYARFIDPTHKNDWNELWTSQGKGMILRSIRTDFKFPMTYPDHVTVYHKLQSMPKETDDSFKLDVVVLSERHRRPAARCVEDVVLYDYRSGKKIMVGELPFLLNGLRRIFNQQNTAIDTWTGRIDKLTQEVRQLEKSSWDREDAVEDLGAVA